MEMALRFIQLILLLAAVFGLPWYKPLWNFMDRFAFGRSTFVKEAVIVMSFLAGVRMLWYLCTLFTEPTVPFVLQVGILPAAFDKFPFSFLLARTPLPVEAWILFGAIGTGCLFYGLVGLPEEGINHATNVSSKIRLSLFWFGFLLDWLLASFMTFPV